MPTRNLILCLAANYTFSDVAPFIYSFGRHIADVDLVIFSANMDAAFESRMLEFGITTLAAELGAYPAFHPQTARFFRYQQFLAQSATRYRDVLITDVRDVIFQGDPFAVGRDRAVSFALEDRLIGECPINSNWLRQAYSEQVAENLADQSISCSGTTIGRADAMTAYVDLMCEEASKTHCSTVGGIDQGFHNFICYQIKPNFAALDREDRIISTIGYTLTDRLSIVDDQILVDEHFAPIVHQWDRHPRIMQAIRKAYQAG